MQVLIAGTDRTTQVDLKTVSVQDVINERSTASFLLNDPSGSLILDLGQTVEMYLAGTKVFGGTIDRIVHVKPPGAGAERSYQIECTDWHQIADRRVAAEVYENRAAGAIVADLVAKCLAGDGIWHSDVAGSSIAAGPTITKAVLNYVPVSQALNELSDLTGYAWWIDADKRIHFAERATYVAPWQLDNPTLVNRLVVEKQRHAYRNRQYVRAGYDLTDVLTERPSPKPDGVTRTFILKFPLAKVPSIRVNGVGQTVGIRQVETGKQWYWSKGDPTIAQDESQPVLVETDVLEVQYQGLFPLVVVAESGDAQVERQSVEGGTGIYEWVEEHAELDDRTAALELAQGLLRKHAAIGTVLDFETWKPGLRPGQLLSVNLPDRKLSGEFLIQSVELSRIGGQYWNYRIRALSGEDVGGWARFFRRLAEKGRTFVIRENEVLVKLKTARDSVKLGDSLVIAKAVPESRVGYAAVGFAEVA